jgi:hypothetical protein
MGVRKGHKNRVKRREYVDPRERKKPEDGESRITIVS